MAQCNTEAYKTKYVHQKPRKLNVTEDKLKDVKMILKGQIYVHVSSAQLQPE